MTSPATTVRRGIGGAFAACLLGGAAAATIALPAASAQPDPCSASGYATTASGVLNAAGGYLATHPGANDVLTAAVNQPAADAERNVRGYFESHPNEYFDLQNIARPLTDLRNRCGTAVTPGQLATLFDALED
ncbi:heme-binding protein [Mycobacterium sp. NPDC050041]|uniref:heme-binding protein n=1 Tax=Mycobacterium sp. NPDC050041 TaxID=3364293 RepID=UPI003C306226